MKGCNIKKKNGGDISAAQIPITILDLGLILTPLTRLDIGVSGCFFFLWDYSYNKWPPGKFTENNFPDGKTIYLHSHHQEEV